MRKRNRQVTFYIDKKDQETLEKLQKKTGMNFSEYMRYICEAIPVKQFPKNDYSDYAKRLREIGYAYNGMLAEYHTNRIPFPERYKAYADQANDLVNEIRAAITANLAKAGIEFKRGED